MKPETKKPKDTKMRESKELEVKKVAAIAVPTTSMQEWGVEASAEDLVIPKLQLIQPMSVKAVDGEALFGEIRDSLNNEKFADFKTSLELIPFFLQRKWVEYAISDKGEKEYLKTTPLISSPSAAGYNDKLAYEEFVDGVKIQRDRVLDFYVLLPSEIESGGLPFVLSFRRSSMKAGKALYTQAYVKNIAAGKTPASYVMNLSVKKESNDKGTYGVLDIKAGRETTPEEMAAVCQWLNIVRAGKTKIDERDLTENDSSPNVAHNADGEPINF